MRFPLLIHIELVSRVAAMLNGKNENCASYEKVSTFEYIISGF
jgi:hypothetical protein